MNIYSKSEIDNIYKASQLAAKSLSFLYDKIVPGISTYEIDEMVSDFVTSRGGICASLNYQGFPKSCCISVNHVVCHGIPSKNTVLKKGDIVNVDVVVKLNNYHGDTSRMFCVGKPSTFAYNLSLHTYNAMMAGIKAIKIGHAVNDIGAAIENYINNCFVRYSIVENYCGHGVGLKLHEAPSIFHYKQSEYQGHLIQEGMCFTVEPMINLGQKYVKTLSDKWTVVTKDKSLSAQWEHTIAIVDGKYKILTIDDNYKIPV